MNRTFFTTILLVAACDLAFGPPAVSSARSDGDEDQEEESSNAKPDAGGIVIEPSGGKIAAGDEITITFPVTIVAPNLRRQSLRLPVISVNASNCLRARKSISIPLMQLASPRRLSTFIFKTAIRTSVFPSR